MSNVISLPARANKSAPSSLRADAERAAQFRSGLNALVTELDVAGTTTFVQYLLERLEIEINLMLIYDLDKALTCVSLIRELEWRLPARRRLPSPDEEIPF